jgi:hypothetical protein
MAAQKRDPCLSRENRYAMKLNLHTIQKYHTPKITTTTPSLIAESTSRGFSLLIMLIGDRFIS